MKKAMLGALVGLIALFGAQNVFAACADLGGDIGIVCCQDGTAAPDVDPENPPANVCGSILIPDVAEIAGCANETGVAGCVVVAEQGVVGGDTLNPPDSITLGTDCEQRAVQACYDCGCDVPPAE